MNGNGSSDSSVVLVVSGMTCGGCANTVIKILRRVPGVTDATVDLDSGRVSVAGEARTEDLIGAVQNAGYGARQAGNTTA